MSTCNDPAVRRAHGRPPVRGAFIVAVAVLIVGAGYVWHAWTAAQLRADRSNFRPVLAMAFERFECGDQAKGEDPDAMIAYGWLVKNQMDDGGVIRVAHLRDLIVYQESPRDIILSRTFDEVTSRVHGFQAFNPFPPLPGLCRDGKPSGAFEIHTVHEHPLDRSITLRQGWGPFGPDVTAPQPRTLY